MSHSLEHTRQQRRTLLVGHHIYYNQKQVPMLRSCKREEILLSHSRPPPKEKQGMKMRLDIVNSQRSVLQSFVKQSLSPTQEKSRIHFKNIDPYLGAPLTVVLVLELKLKMQTRIHNLDGESVNLLSSFSKEKSNCLPQ